MKAKWIDEVKEILASDAFERWLERLEEGRVALRKKTQRHEELLTQVNLLEFRAELAHRNAIDTLENANELEDESAQLANEAAELENRSFEIVSQFEMQRDKCTRLWEQLGAYDVRIEEEPSQAKKLQKQRERINEDYAREDQRKQRLWREVNELWERSIDRDLALVEKRHKGALVRDRAEKLFAIHEREAHQAGDLRREADQMAAEREDAEKSVRETQEAARQEFDCLLHSDFLYWIAQEDNKIVYCTPLIVDDDNYVVPLEPGRVYRCHHQSGIESLELVPEDEGAKADSKKPSPSDDEASSGA